MEQIVKLTGRIAEVFEPQTGVSTRTGNPWMSQDYLFEFFTWSGAQNPNQLVVRIFGEDNIKRHNLQQYEENVTLTLRLDASKTKDGRWFNEVRITNVERAGQQQPVQPAPEVSQGANGGDTGNQPQPQNNAPTGGEKADDLPF